MSDAEKRRTQRQQILPEMGLTGQQKLRNAHVAVVGVGGLGSPAIQYLAAAGVGQLTVIDDDVVDESNLHRQVIHSVASLGQAKTASAAESARRLAPECLVTEHRERLDDANVDQLLAGAEIIIDGSDSFDTRFVVNAAATRLGLPVVWGAVLRWDAQVTVFWPRPAPDSPIAPISLTDVFADTEQTRQTVSCSTAGVIGPICGQAGSLMALEAIKLITGIGTPLIGRMQVMDGLTGESRMLTLAAATNHNPGDVSHHNPDHNSARASNAQQVHPTALVEIPDSAVVLDVRNDSEREQAPLSWPDKCTISVSFDEVMRISPEVPHPALTKISASQPLVVVCTEGPRSIRAARHLASAGYPVAGFLDGGVP